MLTWCVGSLASRELLEHLVVLIMVRVPVPSGWLMWAAPEASHPSTTAGTVDGEATAVLTAETPVLSVFLSA